MFSVFDIMYLDEKGANMNKLSVRIWLTSIAQACNYGTIPNYHGSLLCGQATFGIVIDNGDNALSIGANLLSYCRDEDQSKLITWLKGAYTDDIAELERGVDYRVIYFPSLIED